MVEGPKLGRTARLLKDSVVIGHCKNISVKASADLIKDYDMDTLTPSVVAAGKQTFTWSAEKMYIDGAYMTLLLAGTEFDIEFAPKGTAATVPYETWNDCVILSCERTAGETGGIIEKIQGEAKSVTVHDSA